jgi:hypothetical protein
LKQEPEEPIEVYAERSQELARDGYPYTPGKVIQTLATDSFLKGCYDKRAALTAIKRVNCFEGARQAEPTERTSYRNTDKE